MLGTARKKSSVPQFIPMLFFHPIHPYFIHRMCGGQKHTWNASGWWKNKCVAWCYLTKKVVCFNHIISEQLFLVQSLYSSRATHGIGDQPKKKITMKENWDLGNRLTLLHQEKTDSSWKVQCWCNSMLSKETHHWCRYLPLKDVFWRDAALAFFLMRNSDLRA